MNKKYILPLVVFINTIVFGLLIWLYFLNLARIVEELRLSLLTQQLIKPSLLNNSLAVTLIIIFLQISVATFINTRYLKTKKQILFSSLSVFLIVTLIILASFIPASIEVNRCRLEISNYKGNASGSCFTIADNSRVLVVYVWYMLYLGIYTAATSVASLLLSKTLIKKLN